MHLLFMSCEKPLHKVKNTILNLNMKELLCANFALLLLLSTSTQLHSLLIVYYIE